MSSGNHIVDSADRELDRKGRCSCGGEFESVEWCQDSGEECDPNCGVILLTEPCCMSVDKLRCKKCGSVVDVA